MQAYYLAGRVRALQSRILDRVRLERMIGARNPEDAFRVLVELEYAEFIEENTKPHEFGRIITQGLLETKQMICADMENAEPLNALWWRYDINNLKRGLKLRYCEGGTQLPPLSDDDGFGVLGSMNVGELEALIFQDRAPAEDTSELLLEGVEKAHALLAENPKNTRAVEFALDQTYFDMLGELAKKYRREPFLSELVALWADMANVRALLRSILVIGEPLAPEALLDAGTFEKDILLGIQDENALKAWLGTTRWYAAAEGLDTTQPEESVTRFEKTLDHDYDRFLEESSAASMGLPLIIGYFEQRIRNAHLIKFIMYAKFHGLSQEKIHKALESF